MNLKEYTAFISAAGIEKGTRVLDLGWEGQFGGGELLQTEAHVVFVAEDIRAVRSVGDTCRAVLTHMPVEALDQPVDTVLYRPPQRAAKEQVFEWIEAGFDALETGGQFVLAGRRDRGVESYARHLKSVFDNGTLIARSGRLRVYRSTKHTQGNLARTQRKTTFTLTDVPGAPFDIETMPGVFSADGLDPGTRLLISCLDIASDARILDVGCGWGALGLVAARLARNGSVEMVDANIRAVVCVRRNVYANDIKNASVAVGNLYDTVGNKSFDLIVSNPPFHEGSATAHPLIDGAVTHLEDRGRLLLVVMRPEPYLKRMKAVFGKAKVVARKGGYAILCAQNGT